MKKYTFFGLELTVKESLNIIKALSKQYRLNSIEDEFEYCRSFIHE